jgi:ubiquinone/menaquinone biosynthesis C-methylase UbiE
VPDDNSFSHANLLVKQVWHPNAARSRLSRTTLLIIIQDAFDFIHFRNVAQGITKWPEVLTEAYRCMKPGAYIELTEYDCKLLKFVLFLHRLTHILSVLCRSDDGTLTPYNALVRWGLAMEDAMSKAGRVIPGEEQLKARLKKAGFVDVQAFTMKQPLGPWAKAK